MNHVRRVLSPSGVSYAFGKIVRRGFRVAYTTIDKMKRPIPRFLQRAADLNWYAAVRYVPRPYPGNVTLFCSSESLGDGRAMVDVWQRLAAGGAEIREIDGRHSSLTWEPTLSLLARSIDEFMASLPEEITSPRASERESRIE
jgi:hypothetical protein